MSGKSKDVESASTEVKAKSRATTKTATKPKSKSTASKASSTAKKATKAATSKAPAKRAVRAKSAVKPKTSATSAAKSKAKSNGKRSSNGKSQGNGKAFLIPFTEKQKETLLHMIEDFVSLHKAQPEGLMILTGVERILNKYNQQYTEPDEKFDAIARFGIEKDPRVMHKFFYVNVDCRKKEVDELFVLLSDIAHGKLEYANAAEQLRALHKSLRH